MYFSPQSLQTEYGPGFPMEAAVSNLNGWILTFH